MNYPEGMSVEVSYSPGLGIFHAVTLLNNGDDELFGVGRARLSSALHDLADEIYERYEAGQ